MSTLIIHPNDISTHFLKDVYKNISEKTVITGHVTKDEIGEMIGVHNQVIMLGHGTESGLMNLGNFPGQGGWVIDYYLIRILGEKTNNIFIWCNADAFVKENNLKGMYSGMFISEVHEAHYCGVDATFEDIYVSNNSFANILGESLLKYPKLNDVYQNTIEHYGKIDSDVVRFNLERLYLSK